MRLQSIDENKMFRGKIGYKQHTVTFSVRLNIECHPFPQHYTQWHRPNDPLCLLFQSKFSGEIIKFWTILPIAANSKELFWVISHPMTPLFSFISVTQWLHFLQVNCHRLWPIAPWFDGPVCNPVTFICECPPGPGFFLKRANLHQCFENFWSRTCIITHITHITHMRKHQG